MPNQRQNATPELNLLHKLESAYSALSLVVQDPVVIPNPDFDPEAGNPIVRVQGASVDISRIYFYADDDRGEEVVRRRIIEEGEDIKEALIRHDVMCRTFQDIDEDLSLKDREAIINQVRLLCDKIDNYGRFVRQHKERLGESSFLDFPRYHGGNFSYRKRTRPVATVIEKSKGVIKADFHDENVEALVHTLRPYNPEVTYRGLDAEVRDLKVLLNSFRDSRKPIWRSIYAGDPSGSYDGAIDLTKMLLREHLGFDVN